MALKDLIFAVATNHNLPLVASGLKDFEEVGEEMFFKKMEINYLWSVRYEQQALVEGGGSVYCLSVSATANNNLLMQISTISAPKAAQKRVLFASTLIYI